MHDIHVSVIVPVYNVAPYLPKCLDSILGQSYRNIEVIVVNDGSTDGSLDILQKYAATDNRVRLINQENAGVSAARNNGIKHSVGEYICFVDSDDWIDTDTIERGVRVAAECMVDVVLWGYVKEFSTSSARQPLSAKEEKYTGDDIVTLYRRILGPVGEQLRHPECVDSYVTPWGKLYRASIIRDNNIEFVSTKELGTGEDLLFNVQLFPYIKSAVVLPCCLNHYRKNNASSLTSTHKPHFFTQWTRLQNLIWHEIEGNALLEEAFYNRIACTMIGLGLNEHAADVSYSEHKKRIFDILSTERYKKAIGMMKYSYLPIHWKVFFLSCRYRLFFVYWLLIKVIKKIISR